MSLTYNYTILSLTTTPVDSLNNVISQVSWTLTGTDQNGNSGTFTGVTPFDISTIDTSIFVTYADLTAPVIVEWVQNVVMNNSVYNSHINDEIQNQINAALTTATLVISTDLPWVTSTASNLSASTVSTQSISLVTSATITMPTDS